jgi:hypothetical protein
MYKKIITPTAASQTRRNTNHTSTELGHDQCPLSNIRKNGDKSMKFIKTYKYLAPTSKITHQLSLTNTNQSNQFLEIITVYCTHHTRKNHVGEMQFIFDAAHMAYINVSVV